MDHQVLARCKCLNLSSHQLTMRSTRLPWSISKPLWGSYWTLAYLG